MGSNLFRPEFFSGFNFTTAVIDNVFVSFLAVQIYAIFHIVICIKITMYLQSENQFSFPSMSFQTKKKKMEKADLTEVQGFNRLTN